MLEPRTPTQTKIQFVIDFARKNICNAELPLSAVCLALMKCFTPSHLTRTIAAPQHALKVFKGECEPSLNFLEQLDVLVAAINNGTVGFNGTNFLDLCNSGNEMKIPLKHKSQSSKGKAQLHRLLEKKL